LEAKRKPIELSKRATKDLTKFKEFCSELYGLQRAEVIADNIFKKLELLQDPNIDLNKLGAIDETFLHLKHTYRKLIIGYCKVTYRIGKSKIYIVRVFDTRQDPKKNL